LGKSLPLSGRGIIAKKRGNTKKCWSGVRSEEKGEKEGRTKWGLYNLTRGSGNNWKKRKGSSERSLKIK